MPRSDGARFGITDGKVVHMRDAGTGKLLKALLFFSFSRVFPVKLAPWDFFFAPARASKGSSKFGPVPRQLRAEGRASDV